MKIEPARNANQRRACYALRHRVFVEEQGVPVELEVDEHDEDGAFHIMGMVDETLVATARLCVFDDVAKIQRVAVDKRHRGKSYGRAVILELMERARQNPAVVTIALDAQTQAIGFYKALGFHPTGKPFDDAGIDHIRMEQLARKPNPPG